MRPRSDVLETRPSGNGQVPHASIATAKPSFAKRTAGKMMTVAVIAALAGAAYYGHHTGWRFSAGGHAQEKPSTGSEIRGISDVRFGPAIPDAKNRPPALRQSAAIEFESADAATMAGIDIALTWRGGLTETIAAQGELGFDPARVARVSSRVSGSAWRVLKTMGDPVKAGEVMALVDAVEVGKVKAELQQALVQVKLKRQSLENLKAAGTAASVQLVREAEAALMDGEVRLSGSEQALRNLGFTDFRVADYLTLPPDEIGTRLRLLGVGAIVGEASPATANLYPVRAPFSGVVLSADVVASEMVETGKVLFLVVDPSRVWLTLHTASEDARRVTVGQKVSFRPDGLSDDAVGHVTWIGTAADETTRTVPVRAELPNDSGQLRASTFGRGRVILREIKDAVLVPQSAVQFVDGTAIVFVRDPGFLRPDGPKFLHLRVVQTGAMDAQNTEILSGLEPGEVIAMKGNRLLLDELKRSFATSSTNATHLQPGRTQKEKP